MIFYNGFNLLIDLVILGVAGLVIYKLSRKVENLKVELEATKPPF